MPRHFKQQLRKLEYAAVYAIGPTTGQPVRISYSIDPFERFKEARDASWVEVQVHGIVWTAGRPLAQRIQAEASRLLESRKLQDQWFDVPAMMALQAIHIAADKLNIKTFSHAEMLRRCQDAMRRHIENFRIHAEISLTSKPRRNYFRVTSPKVLPEYPSELPDTRSKKRRKKKWRKKPAASRTRNKPNRDHPFR